MTVICPICNNVADNPKPVDFDGEQINCLRCGKYRISGSANSMLPAALMNNKRKIANASGWIQEHQNVLITTETINQLSILSTPSYGERKRKLLDFLQKNSDSLGQRLRLDNSMMQRLASACWCSDDKEISFLISSAEIDALIEHGGSGLRLTAKGYDYLAQLDVNPASQIGFCAMWFDDSMKAIWRDAISPAILAAGYEPKRIDEHPHNNRIDDEIIALIRRSRFVVADFTGQRGGVYFEAGFALGMNLPVIWTVKKSALADVHFDNRQYNFVTWEEDNLPEFKLNLQYRIEATPLLGRGTWKPS